VSATLLRSGTRNLLGLTLAASLLLAACGSAGSAPSSSSAATTSGGQATATASAPYKVALVVPGPLGDKGFFDSAEAGVTRAQQQLGVQVKTLQASATDPQQWLQNLQSVSGGDYQLVITGSSNIKDQLTKVAQAAPNQHFIYFDDTLNLPNVASIIYKQNEGSFLAGVLAGIVTTDTKDFPLSKGAKKVGLVGGMDIPVIHDFVVGFQQGVAYVDPSIQVQVSYAGTFSDPNKGYDLAKAMYDQGADIVYNVAGGTGLGVLKAAKDANKYAIGVDQDQNDLYPGHIVASMVKNVGNSLYDLIQQAKAGTLQYGKTYTYGLQNGGIGLVLDQQLVPASVQAKLKEATDKVASGQITVKSAVTP
jgi:basic membrane protein A